MKKPGNSENTVKNNSETTVKLDEKSTVENDKNTVEKIYMTEKKEIITSENRSTTHTNNSQSLTNNTEPNPKISTPPVSAASGGYLARPSNIYAESKAEVSTSMPSAEEPVSQKEPPHVSEEPLCDMQMVVRDDIP